MAVTLEESIKRLGRLVAGGTIFEKRGWDRTWGQAERAAGYKIQEPVKMDIFVAELYVAGLPLLKFLGDKNLLNLMPLLNDTILDRLKEEGHLKTNEEQSLFNTLSKERWPIYQKMARDAADSGILPSPPSNLLLAMAKGIALTHDAPPKIERCIASDLLAIFVHSYSLIELT